MDILTNLDIDIINIYNNLYNESMQSVELISKIKNRRKQIIRLSTSVPDFIISIGTSYGIEPIYQSTYIRKIRRLNGYEEVTITPLSFNNSITPSI